MVCWSYCPDLYEKTIKTIGLYDWMMCRNGSNVQVCIDSKSLMLPEENVLPENSKPQQKMMWDLYMLLQK